MRLARVICTHAERFHADEVMACALLRMLPRFKSYDIVRTRDPRKLLTAEVLIDIGDEYDPSRLRFDHHQVGFTESFSHETQEVLMSSAGLVYKEFGTEVFKEVLNVTDPESVSYLRRRIYETLIKYIDIKDNGTDVGRPMFLDFTDFSSEVSRMNQLDWSDLQDKSFRRALEYAAATFLEIAQFAVDYSLPSWHTVRRAAASSKRLDPSGKVLVLREPCRWEDELYYLREPVAYCVLRETQWWRVVRTQKHGIKAKRSRLAALYEQCAKLKDVKFLKPDFGCGGAWSAEAGVALARTIIDWEEEEAKKVT